MFVVVAAVLCVGCTATPVVPTPVPATPTVLVATPAPATPTVLVATPAPVWKDKLNGIWIDETTSTEVYWTIDLDAGTFALTFGGVRDRDPASIAFDHEEGKTIFVHFDAIGKNPARVDRFRFLNDDLVAWEQDTRSTMLQRKK